MGWADRWQIPLQHASEACHKDAALASTPSSSSSLEEVALIFKEEGLASFASPVLELESPLGINMDWLRQSSEATDEVFGLYLS